MGATNIRLERRFFIIFDQLFRALVAVDCRIGKYIYMHIYIYRKKERREERGEREKR